MFVSSAVSFPIDLSGFCAFEDGLVVVSELCFCGSNEIERFGYVCVVHIASIASDVDNALQFADTFIDFSFPLKCECVLCEDNGIGVGLL